MTGRRRLPTWSTAVVLAASLFAGCLAPARPRFVYVPATYPDAKIDARAVSVAVEDDRTNVVAPANQEPVLTLASEGKTAVPLPPGFDDEVRARTKRLVTPSATRELKLVIAVERCFVESPADGVRTIRVELTAEFSTEDGRALATGSGTGSKELTGPAHDDAELAELHRAAALDALDAMLIRSPKVVNEMLQRYASEP